MSNNTSSSKVKKLQDAFSNDLPQYIAKVEQYKFEPTAYKSISIENASAYSKTSEQQLKNDLGEIKDNAVYVISTLHWDKELIEEFEKCKDSGYQMSRIIDPAPTQINDRTYLYVGSSKGNVETRLKQHIGITESKSVYSLHLNKWWENATIDIDVYQFDNISSQELQFIEDWLWDHYQPIFGKRGGK